MNAKFTRFIPIYAAPDSVSSATTNNILFCNDQGQSERAYSLECLEGLYPCLVYRVVPLDINNIKIDMHKLQQAITGYKVVHDTET